jgi:hypothetical protein
VMSRSESLALTAGAQRLIKGYETPATFLPLGSAIVTLESGSGRWIGATARSSESNGLNIAEVRGLNA